MSQPPPGSTRTDTLFPYTTLFRSRGGWLQRPGRIASLFQVRAVVEGDPDQRPGGMAAPLQLARRMLRMSEVHDIGRLRPFEASQVVLLVGRLQAQRHRFARAAAQHRHVVDVDSLGATVDELDVERACRGGESHHVRSEEHTSELKSLMRI